MGSFILKRLLQSLIVFFGVIVVTFVLMDMIPGNAASVLMGEKQNKSTYERVVKEMELDKPVSYRFKKYIGKLAKMDLGDSVIMNRPVIDIISEAFPNTIKLTTFGILFAWVFGSLFGIISAYYSNTAIDYIFSGISVVGISIPTFWIGILLQYVVGYRFGLLPISGFTSFSHMIIPSIVLGWSFAGEIARLLRANILETKEAKFIDLAVSKGISYRRMFFKHMLRASFLPVITIMILQVTTLLGGAIITEGIFGIPGIGTLSISALTNRDLPLLQGTILLATVLVIFGNLISDLIYPLLDPRIVIGRE